MFESGSAVQIAIPASCAYASAKLSFDTDTYKICKRYLSTKDTLLKKLVVKTITQVQKSHERISVCDLGSGNGEIIEVIFNSGADVSLDLVEPEEKYVRQLQQRFKKEIASGKVKIFEVDLDDFLKVSKSCSYHVIFATHFFYHIRRSQWKARIEDLKSLLSNGGLIVSSLVSEGSDIYRLFRDDSEDFLIDCSDENLRKHGQYIFGEDFVSYLKENNLDMNVSELNAVLNIPFSDVLLARKNCFENSTKSDFINFLSFMLRVDYQSAKRNFCKFLSTYSVPDTLYTKDLILHIKK